MIPDSRNAVHREVSDRLARCSDERLLALVAGAGSTGRDVGGQTGQIDVDGTAVFVKKIPLTDLERRPEHRHSTANLFGLPVFCQYGVGFPGFGAWRELAAQLMTTDWVLSRRCANFPLLYHWRILPDTARPWESDIDQILAFDVDSAPLRDRIAALDGSSAAIVLFMEHLPPRLGAWLDRTGLDETAYTMAERDLLDTTRFMTSQGLLHFDAHFDNVLTDGRRLYFADFGLAVSTGFALSGAESRFVARHSGYDHGKAATTLVHTLVRAAEPGRNRREAVRECARTGSAAWLPQWASDLLARHAPVATVMGDFFDELVSTSLSTPYPTEAMARLIAEHA